MLLICGEHCSSKLFEGFGCNSESPRGLFVASIVREICQFIWLVFKKLFERLFYNSTGRWYLLVASIVRQNELNNLGEAQFKLNDYHIFIESKNAQQQPNTSQVGFQCFVDKKVINLKSNTS